MSLQIYSKRVAERPKGYQKGEKSYRQSKQIQKDYRYRQWY